MAFTDMVALHGNVTFRGRVKMAMFTTARSVLAQSSPASGNLAAAKFVIDQPEQALERTMNALAGSSAFATAAASDQTGANITDANLQIAVESALGALVR